MLKCAGAKLVMYYREGKVHLSAVPLVDYSQDEEWDSDQMNFQISSNERPGKSSDLPGKMVDLR